jgi:crotonobetainyl-CoA:carnitine CoA-transferase CaiB-like acyl-CoA transferase
LDVSTLFAGPFLATMLGDHGAEVIKVEHPRGDESRNWGLSKDGVPLFWKVISRNKENIAIDLNKSEGQEILKKLAKRADVLIENFRPSRMENWGIGWETLHKLNPELIMARVTGFGQTGIYSNLAGFGTLAEAMSGFAYVTGSADGPPTLPSFGLADGIAGLSGAYAVASALFKREKTHQGEMIDIALYEPLMWIVGGHIVEFDQLHVIQKRQGNRSPRVCPRNAYMTKDLKWVALSASAESIAKRVFQAIGHPELLDDPRFESNKARLANVEMVDRIIDEWMKEHTQEEAINILRKAEAAVAPVYDASQIYTDKHFRERGSIIKVNDDDLGEITMQGAFPQILSDPAKIKFTGKSKIGSDTEKIMLSLGYEQSEIDNFKSKKVIV